MNFITGISTTASALHAEKVRMDVVAQNIANAHTTRDVNGKAYQRKVVSFAAALDASSGSTGVQVSKITDDTTPGERIYNPEHPDAGPDGMVEMPNVNTAVEMVDLISASRAYEANLAVARNARQMATKALSIGR
jgi:flagellar basal-body rod protein FlgC